MKTMPQTRSQVSPTLPTAPARSVLLQRKCACGVRTVAGGECAGCRAEREGMLQRSGPGRGRCEGAPPIVNEVLRSPGRPLDGKTRAFVEPRFGFDFSRVRVHTNDLAAESADAVGATAYTVGQDVVFGRGRYAPDTEAGRRLLAHELTHTVQQSLAGPPSLSGAPRVSEPGDADEREAEAVAERVMSGGVRGAGPMVRPAAGGIQRLGDLTKVPPGVQADCEIASDSPAAATDFVLFANAGTTLSAAQQAQLQNFVVNWRAAGANAPVRIDGYASTPGSDELNWQLSCDRARAVAAELMSPSSGIAGIPARFLRTVAQGETTEFGAEANNRRASIFSTLAPTPPSPPAPTTCTGGAAPVSTVAACIQPIVVAETDGSRPLTAPSFAMVQSIWGKCCLNVTINSTIVVANSALKEIDDAGSGAPMTAEETTLFASAGSGCIPVAVVDTIRRGATADKTVAGGGTTKDFGTSQPKVIVDEGVDPSVVAHEVGHALSLGHGDDVGGLTVMHPSGAFNVPVPQGVTTGICTKARAAPAATGSGVTPCCQTTI